MEEPVDPHIFERVTIIGLGLIGSSIARALRQYGLADSIVGCDANEVTLAYARTQKFIDSGTTDLKAAVKNSQLVILATPPSTLAHIAQQIGPALRQGAIVMDTASVKQQAMDAICAHLPSHAEFIPAHPIAGSEQAGAAAGKADLFKGKRVVVTPHEPINTQLLQAVTAFWMAMGARVEAMPAPLHDQIYAYVSHLPQLLAFAAAQTVGEHPEKLAKFLRLSGSNPALWIDIFMNNKENIFNALDKYLDALVHVQNELAGGQDKSQNDNSLARTVLFPRIAASCLITTVMSAEKQAGLSFARFAGTGFADFTSPAAGAPEGDIEAISNHYAAVIPVLRDYTQRLIHFRKLIETKKWAELEKALIAA